MIKSNNNHNQQTSIKPDRIPLQLNDSEGKTEVGGGFKMRNQGLTG